MIQLAIFTTYGGTLIGDYSHKASKVVFSTNNRGMAECTAFLSLSLQESFALYNRTGLPHVQLFASHVIFEGRLEDVSLVNGGVNITALGYSRAMTDAPYTALWSTTDYSLWKPTTQVEVANRTPDKYNIDTNGRIYISTKKGQTYTNGADVGGVILKAPYGSRKIVGFSCDFTVNLPNPVPSWTFGYATFDEGFAAAVATTITATSGAAFNRTVHYVVTACDYLELFIYNTTGAASTPAGEDGANYLQILNLRVVTTTTNRVNTTLGTTFGAGGSQTVTPPSMANIYVGQQLQIKQGSVTSCTVTVTAKTATTFTAVFPGGFNLADAVNAHVVYASEIAQVLVSTTATLNSTQLSSSTTLIQNPSIDLFNETYTDLLPSAVLDHLITLGDNQTTPRQWEWGVGAAQQLYLRPQLGQRTWYIDVSDLEVQRTLEELANSVYAVYQDARGRDVRATATADATSVTRYGLTRRRSISVQTTSSTQAATQQAAALSDGKDPKPRSGVTIRQVFDANGSQYPLWSVAAGDTVIIRNLSPSLSTALDRIRVFRVSRAEYSADSNTLSIEPETPLPSLSALLSRALSPGFRGRPFIAPR